MSLGHRKIENGWKYAKNESEKDNNKKTSIFWTCPKCKQHMGFGIFAMMLLLLLILFLFW